MIVISTRASGKHRRSRGDLWIKTLFSRGPGGGGSCLAVFLGGRPAALTNRLPKSVFRGEITDC